MAKNLKLNIKNAQLAEALKLGKVKKAPAAAAPKKEAEPTATPVTEEAATPKKTRKAAAPTAEARAKKEEAAPEIAPEPIKAPEAAKVEPEVKAEEPRPEKVAEKAPEKPPIKPQTPAPSKPPFESRPREYTPRESQPYRRPYQPSQPGGRPPYRPGGYQPGPRPAGPGGYQGPRTGGYQGPRPSPGYQGGPRREFSLPGQVRRPPPTEMPTPPKPGAAPARGRPEGEADKGGPRKAGFKEFRDVKPQKRPESKRTFDARDRQGLRDTDDEAWRKKRPSHKARPIGVTEEMIVRPKELSVRIPISVKDLAAAMKLKASQLLAKLFMQGVVLTLNDFLDDETTIQLLGHEFECEIKIDRTEEERIRVTDKTIKQEIQETPAATLILRPPVVTFMGHVDHGKTSLIDKIRATNIAAGEAGAITQHIGAFKCHTAVGDIAILDTPGHEAFSAMRTRGADVTDIIVLVIAGDEGMRAQTLEAIEQAQKALVPIVVAINKSDKPNFNAETVYRQLADNNLLPEVWGGTTITVNCSAHTGTGIKELLEMLALQAEILELKANPHSRARGTVIESEMHKGMGPVATLLVQNGTLRLGDALVFGQNWARIKTMHDEKGKELTEAGPSTPVKITGLSGLPDAGSEFIVVKSEKEARDVSYERVLGKKTATLQQAKRAGLESLMQQGGAKQEKKTLNLILRADVQGSLDALKTSILKIASDKVVINIISADVGEISESDIELASASKAPIVGFHTQIERRADRLIKETKVVVKLHDVIYHAVDDIKTLMLGLLDKIAQENDTGTAEVRATFKASQLGVIAGCSVTDGTIRRNNHIRVQRDGEVVWKGPIASLKRVKEDVREVTKGMECGILLQNFNDVKAGDILQAYEITYLQQEL